MSVRPTDAGTGTCSGYTRVMTGARVQVMTGAGVQVMTGAGVQTLAGRQGNVEVVAEGNRVRKETGN